MADIKISELEPTTDLEGLFTIGSDKNNLSKKVSLQFLKDAANYANEQGDYAKQAGDTVNGNVGVSDYPEFSASKSYVIGDIVRYNGVLYQFTANHAASAWNGSDVKNTSIKAITSGKLTELESKTSVSESELAETSIFQFLNKSSAKQGYWNEALNIPSNADILAYEPVLLLKGKTYKFFNVYGYFCQFANENGEYIGHLTDKLDNEITLTYTPTENVFAYVSVRKEQEGMLINSADYIPQSYSEGVLALNPSFVDKTIDLYVGADKEYTKIIDAVKVANLISTGKIDINIYIDSGNYNLYEELGGREWLSSLTSRSQGLYLKDRVNLFGNGYVNIRFELPDDITYEQSSICSAIDLDKYSNRLENLNFYARNCRYVLHDENNGLQNPIKHIVKNCRFEMLGTSDGLWPYISTLGGGCGGNGQYDFVNCMFINPTYNIGFSFHTNDGQPSHFNVDGCVSIVKDAEGASFRCAYYGLTHEGRTIFHFKNCTGNGKVIKTNETVDTSEDHIDMYVNGYDVIQ